MATQKEPNVDLNQQVTLTAADLLKLFASIQESQQASAETQAKVLAEAFAESRKPYVDPKVEQNNINAREQLRRIELNKIRAQKLQAKNCPHEQNLTGSGNAGNRESAFHFLKLPTGEWIGICPYCRYIASSLRPKDAKFFRKAAGVPAESGTPVMLADPVAAQLARYTPEQREQILRERAEYQVQNPVSPENDEELV